MAAAVRAQQRGGGHFATQPHALANGLHTLGFHYTLLVLFQPHQGAGTRLLDRRRRGLTSLLGGGTSTVLLFQ